MARRTSNTSTALPWLLLGLALVAIIGVLGWRALGDESGSATAQTRDELPTERARASSDRPEPLDGSRLRRAAKARVRGRVLDDAGAGIEGARVCAIAEDEALQGAARVEPVCVLSQAGGAYDLGGLWPVRSQLVASARGYEPQIWRPGPRQRGRRARIELSPGLEREAIDFELASGGVSLVGVVKDIAGGPIEGAWVSSGGAQASSDEEGRFELWVAAGTMNVSAASQGYAKGGSVRALAPGEFVELFLTPESVLIGRVVDLETGEPVAGASVDSGPRAPVVLSDDEGLFRVEGLEPGIYKPQATADHGYGQVAESIHLGLGETSELVEIQLHPMASIAGRVVLADADKTPCSEGWVVLQAASGQRYRAAVERGEGELRFRGVAPGSYQVHPGCVGAVPSEPYPELVVGGDDQIGLEWEVEPGLSIRGRIVDGAGAPVEGVRVSARMILTGAEAREHQQSSDSDVSLDDGSFALDGLLPGDYEVSTSSWHGRPGPREPLELELGSADLEGIQIEMPASGAVRGRLLDEGGEPLAATLVAVAVEGRARQRTRSGDDGRFEFEHLRPGNTRITATEDGGWAGGLTMRKPGTNDDDLQGEVVEVVAGEVRDVELVVEKRSGTIRGRVRDTGGPVADAFIDIERMPDAAGTNERSARRSVRWSWGEQPVLTDKEGGFVIEGLPEGEFILRAHRKGGGEALAEHVALGSAVELMITDTSELAGTLQIAGTEVPERFAIQVRELDTGFRRREQYFRTGGAWRLSELPGGRYELTASAEGGSLESELELEPGEVREDITLTLQPHLTLDGRLVDLESGEPVPGLSVMIGGRDFSFGAGDPERANISDDDGRFTVRNAPSGQVWLTAYAIGAGTKSPYAGLFQQLHLPAEPLVQDLGELPVLRRRLGPQDKAGDIGMTLEQFDFMAAQADTKLVVAFVRPGGPAQDAELAVGDEIVKVDGHDVVGVNAGRWSTLSQVVAGTKLGLTLAGGRERTLVVGPPL